MDKIEIDTYFGDKPTHVEIASPMEVGGKIYHAMARGCYNGIAMMAPERWGTHLHRNTILTGDDVKL